nr:M23 family metallopeptidase [uncultured Blautia sp.]
MMNNRITRIIANTVGLAAVAAMGITVYQLGTSPAKEKTSEEQTEKSVQSNQNEDTDEQSMVDAGADQVKSENRPLISDEEDLDDVELSSENENSDGDIDDDSVEKSEIKTATDVDKSDNISDMNDQQNTETSSQITNDDLQDEKNHENGETTDVSASAINLPDVNFSEDTLMEWPVNGNILQDYSMDQTVYFSTLDQYKLSPAIAVGAVEGAPVVAAVNGTVYSVEQDIQTGTTVTMELGNGYQAIYGQLADLTVAEGDTVKKGTTIGYIAQPTKYYSTEGTNLYFEMKKDGEPIDPIAYLP